MGGDREAVEAAEKQKKKDREGKKLCRQMEWSKALAGNSEATKISESTIRERRREKPGNTSDCREKGKEQDFWQGTVKLPQQVKTKRKQIGKETNYKEKDNGLKKGKKKKKERNTP